jgi:hypothetical protein
MAAVLALLRFRLRLLPRAGIAAEEVRVLLLKDTTMRRTRMMTTT